nr:hypothetical protein [Mycobacterium dioxanotrophicus]
MISTVPETIIERRSGAAALDVVDVDVRSVRMRCADILPPIRHARVAAAAVRPPRESTPETAPRIAGYACATAHP